MSRLLTRLVLLASFVVLALLTVNISSALTAESLNMELVGTNDLQARSAYQPIIQRQGNRWILYAGHHAVGTNPVTGVRLPSFNPLTGMEQGDDASTPDSSGRSHPRSIPRSGPHSTNEAFGPPFYQKILFIAYFNAGVRAVDIRDPFRPKEVGFFIPDATANTDFRCATHNGVQSCQQAIQTNNVETDERGFIYTNDRANTGLHIYQLTGAAAKILKE